MIIPAHIQCSSTCAGGTQVRNVTCVQFIPELDNETGAVLTDNNDQPIGMDVVQSDDLCDGLQRPSGSRPCNFQIPCPNRWFPGPWGPVSVSIQYIHPVYPQSW